ncbi:hypothetical protein D779_1477 [Imhoffiella purpurea]|uniref:Uncharacterized protein n=1 Tax=Imhoffiella purpurea TaxID=1249627 RepID=W9VEH7_9GAMM|nr:hypothetical protein D779_1477 [Imhoffiella purpurea]
MVRGPRRVAGILALLIGSLAVGFVPLMPMSTNVARYLWWRATADPHPQVGRVISDGAAIH